MPTGLVRRILQARRLAIVKDETDSTHYVAVVEKDATAPSKFGFRTSKAASRPDTLDEAAPMPGLHCVSTRSAGKRRQGLPDARDAKRIEEGRQTALTSGALLSPLTCSDAGRTVRINVSLDGAGRSDRRSGTGTRLPLCLYRAGGAREDHGLKFYAFYAHNLTQTSRARTTPAARRRAPDRDRARRGTARSADRFCPPRENSHARDSPTLPVVLAPPGALDAFGPVGSDHLVQRATPAKT